MKRKNTVIILLIISLLLIWVPFFALRGAEFGGSDDGSVKPQSVSPVISATLKICLPTVSAVTTFLSCNRSCGWGCKK